MTIRQIVSFTKELFGLFALILIVALCAITFVSAFFGFHVFCFVGGICALCIYGLVVLID